MSDFGGIRKPERTQHALVVLGSAALAAAVRQPEVPERNNMYKINNKNM